MTVEVSGGDRMGSSCGHYRDITNSKNLCFEYSVPELKGMSAEECVLLAIALDLEIDP